MARRKKAEIAALAEDGRDDFRSAVVRAGLVGGVEARSVGARRLLTVGAERMALSLASGVLERELAGVVAVRVDPEGATDEAIDAYATMVRGFGIAVRVLPRRKSSVLPESVVERAARRSIREVVGELVAGANVEGADRALLEEIVEQKLGEVGL